ncbi:ROK family protein [Streptococcus downei]|uniref:Transcriptional regulator n=1 Tax=Streptococcus downei MFe28 TaxID=764290 RepID=A0A380JG78_STRDO|nr:ROK family protein [Streptococcus downei]EFQ58104.1 ROK family protein [Streptococcus downei F0415]SUN37352.1 transcriptional regulator [Streptococcus downei MFe28]
MIVLPIDIGGTQIKSGLVSDDYQIEATFPPLPSPDNLSDCLALFDDLIQPVLLQISGIAISAPGTIDTKQSIIYYGGTLPFLHDFKVKDYFAKTYGLPASALNDGKAAVLAELARGNLQGCQNAAALVLGTGLGGGLVLNGQLYQGTHFQAGELTFLLPPKLAKIEIGEMRGVEVSAVALVQRLAELLGLADKTDGRSVFQALEQKDKRVYSIFEDYCRYVALTILNLQTTLDLERFAIGGGISAQPLLLEEINRQFDRLKEEVAPVSTIIERPDIVACRHHNHANLIGAAYLFQTEQG